MSTSDPASLMYEIFRLREEIDRMAARLNQSTPIFSSLSMPMPKLTPPELGLLRAVSWFYVLYYEVGKVNVEFLNERLSAYNLDLEQKVANHLHTVEQLRTFFQHNLDPSRPHDRKIQEDCEQWFQNQCKTYEPRNNEHWQGCLIGFPHEAHSFFVALQKCIHCIEQDESREQILRDWDFRRNRYHPPYEFDELISIVAADMGRGALDHVRLRKRFYDKWIKELQLLQGDYDFKVEARKLIEHVLLNETTAVLPITGNDIMQEFSIPPDQQVGQLLELARNLHNADPYLSHADLLEKLRQKMTNITTQPRGSRHYS